MHVQPRTLSHCRLLLALRTAGWPARTRRPVAKQLHTPALRRRRLHADGGGRCAEKGPHHVAGPARLLLTGAAHRAVAKGKEARVRVLEQVALVAERRTALVLHSTATEQWRTEGSLQSTGKLGTSATIEIAQHKDATSAAADIE